MQLYGVRRVSKFKAVAICLTLACALTIPAHATIIIVATPVAMIRGSLRQALVDANDRETIETRESPASLQQRDNQTK